MEGQGSATKNSIAYCMHLEESDLEHTTNIHSISVHDFHYENMSMQLQRFFSAEKN